MSSQGGKVYLPSFQKNIEKMDFYIDEEQRILSKVKNEFASLAAFYDGTNNTSLNRFNNEFVCQCNMISNNRKDYLQNLHRVVDLYKDTERSSTNIINRSE